MTARTRKPAAHRSATVGIRVTHAEFRAWQAYQRLPETKKALCRRYMRAVAQAHAA